MPDSPAGPPALEHPTSNNYRNLARPCTATQGAQVINETRRAKRIFAPRKEVREWRYNTSRPQPKEYQHSAARRPRCVESSLREPGESPGVVVERAPGSDFLAADFCYLPSAYCLPPTAYFPLRLGHPTSTADSAGHCARARGGGRSDPCQASEHQALLRSAGAL